MRYYYVPYLITIGNSAGGNGSVVVSTPGQIRTAADARALSEQVRKEVEDAADRPPGPVGVTVLSWTELEG